MAAEFAAQLARYGPQAPAASAPSREVARAYCRRLARSHYENFHVASLLVPRRLRQHFYNVYAYCRWADDLADETGDPQRSLELLDWWEDELRACYAGRAGHPVFVALAETVEQFDIPIEPFADLLVAFRQDQRVARYETAEDVLGYCRYSANPVGRLVLYLAGSCDERRRALSDAICTGLQRANFCQDVAGDWDRGRVYLPQEACRRFGYDESMFARREYNDAFCALLASEVDRAEGWLRRGLPLTEGLLPGRIGMDVWIMAQGGLAVLEGVRRVDYDVWNRRPTVPRRKQVLLFLGALWQLRPGGLRRGAS